ncbi:P-loop containing nucleoside triphosphate hydrolase protein, partial [Macrolepiota fuliginosa MF-IS2]
GKISTVGDLVLARPQDLAKRCHVPLEHIIKLIQATYNNQDAPAITFQTLEGAGPDEGKAFSIGDPELDDTLGGGLRTGMIWEIVGESAAGKTQFALQSSLHVQLPREQGGLDGSTCYLTTSTGLQTTRLLQILQARNLSDASLEDVYTLSAPTVHVLLNVLEGTLPTYI